MDSAQLLKALEPAVRPGGLPTPQRVATPPIEAQDFESLLQEARFSAAPPPGKAQTLETQTNHNLVGHAPIADQPIASAGNLTLNTLLGVDRIDNVSIRNVIANVIQPS